MVGVFFQLMDKIPYVATKVQKKLDPGFKKYNFFQVYEK